MPPLALFFLEKSLITYGLVYYSGLYRQVRMGWSTTVDSIDRYVRTYVVLVNRWFSRQISAYFNHILNSLHLQHR